MGKTLGLSSLELKALSVPSSLRFLLGVEYDVLLCVTEVGKRRSCTIRFPVLGINFQKLLELCAERFGLCCTQNEDHSLLSGTAIIPPLRYIDYLPGALHAEELLSCLGVKPVTNPKRYGASVHDFLASFIDYSGYNTDASLADVHGTGFYLTLDHGLSTATHSHLVKISFHKGCSLEEALREFEEFSGWTTFDIRYEDVDDKLAGGVVVMPSVQDACDLFEKYEDEDSDDEGGLLPFMLRPVSPLTSVPSVEDSALKRLRDHQWGEIEKFWERFPKWKNCVVVSNLYESASLEEALALFKDLTVTASSLVEDNSPARRRRVFVTFATSDEAKIALFVDGKSTKGKTLRVQVSPPYLNESRRGRVLESRPPSLSEPPGQQPATETRPVSLGSPAHAREKRDAAASNNPEASTPSGRDRSSKKAGDDKNWNAPVPTSRTPTQEAASAPVTGAAAAREGGDQKKTATPPKQPQCSPIIVASTMNANAREFVPSSTYQASTTSPEYYHSSIPMAYLDENYGQPPPCYPAVALGPVGMVRPMGVVPRSLRSGAAPPPYSSPPPYSMVSGQSMQMAQPPPPPPPPSS
ncbi:hypothetical protein ECC02_001383 [Trypanosoma cruzi]|uniref:RRM domain-containing protein n=1 Tax=Trypanosoma cruzi TaxID=5693 RepID=A0A7J6YG95_TRYCR|nr:hypothetical protein ECC02_001383 [Trypanosoma cruzi]